MSEMKFLTPEQIRELPTLVTEELEVPEWGGKVLVKVLSARERDEFEASMMTVDSKGRPVDNRKNARARLVQLAVVHEDGRPYFTKHDIRTLGELPASGLQRVFNKVNEMSAISEKDLESIVEDFDGVPDESSPSD